MAFTIWKTAREYKFLISLVSGEQPSLAQLDAKTIGFNAADNLWYVEDASTQPATVIQVNATMVAGTVGVDAVPVVRTNNPIVGVNKPNQNIQALDAAIGTDAQVTPVVRTAGPVVVNTSVHQKIDALDTAIGVNTVPVVRTNNPLVAANTVGANLNALDAAIGTDAQVVPLARTVGPVVVNTTVHQKVDALDAAIGVDVVPVVRTNNPIASANAVGANLNALDAAIGTTAQLTPVTRTTGQLVDNTSIQTKLDVIDALIGFDAQMSASPTNISKSQTIYQNLDALAAYKSVRTVKKTVGNFGVAGCDFNFAANANTTEQPIDLGAILPAKCRIVDSMIFTDAAFTNLGNLTTDLGLTTGTDGLIVAANNTALNAIMAMANAGAFAVTPNAAAQNVWLNVAPTNAWNSASPVGKMSVYITFIDLTNI